jgi:hypothetical protein
MKDYLAKGFRLMAYGVDIGIFQNALAQGIDYMHANAKPAKRKGKGRAKAKAKAKGRAGK